MAKRVVTRLSDKQFEAFNIVMELQNVDEATLLRRALRSYMQEYERFIGGNWPEDDPEHGGKREGAGWPKGRPRKNGGRKSKIATLQSSGTHDIL